MSVTLKPINAFPPGTSVGAYLLSNWLESELPPSGAPKGSAQQTVAVQTDGSLTFTTLTDDTRYVASAQVNGEWRHVRFRYVSDAPAESRKISVSGPLFATGHLKTEKPRNWAQGQAPAVATRATTTKAAGAAGVKHVCTAILVTLTNAATAAAGDITIELRDGASGAGTVLWSARLSIPAVAGTSREISLTDLAIEGSAATAMTLETTASGGASTFASVNLAGYSA